MEQYPQSSSVTLQESISREERLKRRFLSLCIMIMAPVILVFGLKDFVDAQYLEGALVFGIVTLLMGLFIILNRSRAYVGIMRTVAGLLTFTLFYEFYTGGGNGGAFQWMFIMPTGLVFLLGFSEGAVWISGIGVLMTVMVFRHIGHEYSKDLILRFLGAFFTVSTVSCGLELIRERYFKQLIEEKEALQKALDEIHELKGLVPICASCKKIRDDQGFWTQIETYMQDRSDLEFSHGICPDCAERLFPGKESEGPSTPAATPTVPS
jgi:hypothetical protein